MEILVLGYSLVSATGEVTYLDLLLFPALPFKIMNVRIQEPSEFLKIIDYVQLRMAQLQQQQQQQHQQNSNQQLQQHALSGQHSQSSSHNLHQQDKIVGAGSVTADGSMSNSFRGNDQVCPSLATGDILFSMSIYLALETCSTLRYSLKVAVVFFILSHYLYPVLGVSSLFFSMQLMDSKFKTFHV